jgi:hypothetical protein
MRIIFPLWGLGGFFFLHLKYAIFMTIGARSIGEMNIFLNHKNSIDNTKSYLKLVCHKAEIFIANIEDLAKFCKLVI